MTTPASTPAELVDAARKILDGLWKQVGRRSGASGLRDIIQGKLATDIRAAVNSKSKSYRYVLPTQLAAKAASPDLDCRCLQMARGGRGAFDARTIAHGVVVPFDQTNNNVLGGSPEPYVNNPLRVSEVSAKFREPQKNKTDWDALCRVLAQVEERNANAFTRQVLEQTLIEIHRRLADSHVVYPTPKRISLDGVLQIINEFLAASSGGDRLLALASALFAVVGKRFHLYAEVRRGNITAADASTGLLADLECVGENGDPLLVVEVKDRDLTITHLRTKMADIREKQVSEIFFIAQQGVAPEDHDMVAQQVAKEFVSGQNVYITDLPTLCRTALALLGELGRRDFVREVGAQLDRYRSDIIHRRAWAQLLASV